MSAGAAEAPYTLVRISRRHWEADGGVNNPDLILRTAKRGPDRYYVKVPRNDKEARHSGRPVPVAEIPGCYAYAALRQAAVAMVRVR